MNPKSQELKRRLGAAVRERRRLKKMKQADLAEAAGINRSHLSLIESGEHRPTEDTIGKIAAALETTPENLEWTGEYLAGLSEIDGGRMYPGLAELLNDPDEIRRYKITEEEQNALRTIRLQWRNPSKQFFLEALFDYRLSQDTEG